MGSIQWLDTGWEIPEILYQNLLSSYVLKPAYKKQVDHLFDFTSEVGERAMPDCFVTSEGELFISHFIQASIKMKTLNGREDYYHFTEKVKAHLTA
jgi:hypothetical protein